MVKAGKKTEDHKRRAKEQQDELKFELNDMVKAGKKSEDHNSAISNIKILHKSQAKVITLFHDYFRTVTETKYTIKCGKVTEHQFLNDSSCTNKTR